MKCQEKPSGFYRMQENAFRPGLRLAPRWGSLQRSPDTLADGKEGGCPLPTENPTSALGLSDLEFQPEGSPVPASQF